MDIHRLAHSPIGRLVPIGVPVEGSIEATGKYCAYVPASLPAVPAVSMAAMDAATKAAMAVARLDQAVSQLPTPDLLIRPIIRREATSTSALEGTYAEFDEVLEADFLDDRQMSSEQREISNVVRATEVAVQLITTRPISRKLIGELQQIIVRGTDGETYDAGDLRNRQVYIGPKNRPVEEARFVPCPPGDLLADGFSDWEKWINAENNVPVVVKMALGHYQFETLHPYADGNGRLGRLILNLQLLEEQALRWPVLDISSWLETRRTQYMDGLLETTCSGDFNPWIEFFSTGVREQAEKGIKNIETLLNFRDALVSAVRRRSLRGGALVLAEKMIGYPVLDVRLAQALTETTFQAANTAISRLVDLGVLRELTGQRVNRLFSCAPVLELLGMRRETGSAQRLINDLNAG
ncbi:MAG TPA: Fic/DOC family N-terminal domain-containing protein [Jatrophihabitans sp.]